MGDQPGVLVANHNELQLLQQVGSLVPGGLLPRDPVVEQLQVWAAGSFSSDVQVPLLLKGRMVVTSGCAVLM